MSQHPSKFGFGTQRFFARVSGEGEPRWFMAASKAQAEAEAKTWCEEQFGRAQAQGLMRILSFKTEVFSTSELLDKPASFVTSMPLRLFVYLNRVVD